MLPGTIGRSLQLLAEAPEAQTQVLAQDTYQRVSSVELPAEAEYRRSGRLPASFGYHLLHLRKPELFFMDESVHYILSLSVCVVLNSLFRSFFFPSLSLSFSPISTTGPFCFRVLLPNAIRRTPPRPAARPRAAARMRRSSGR